MRNFTYLLNLLVLLLLPQAVMAQVSLPYSQAFDNEQAFKTFTVIDGNGGGFAVIRAEDLIYVLAVEGKANQQNGNCDDESKHSVPPLKIVFPGGW